MAYISPLLFRARRISRLGRVQLLSLSGPIGLERELSPSVYSARSHRVARRKYTLTCVSNTDLISAESEHLSSSHSTSKSRWLFLEFFRSPVFFCPVSLSFAHDFESNLRRSVCTLSSILSNFSWSTSTVESSTRTFASLALWVFPTKSPPSATCRRPSIRTTSRP